MENLFVIFDTETTDLLSSKVVPAERQPRVIEFAGIQAQVQPDGSHTIVKELQFMCYPGFKINEEVTTKITGITHDMLKGQPLFSHYAQDVYQFFRGPEDEFGKASIAGVVGHNVTFDISMLNYEFARINLPNWLDKGVRQICTVENTEHVKGYRLNLASLYEYLFKESFAGAHRAMIDTKATLRIFCELMKRGWI
jgi:DNA polymerase-3 subunit alpha